MARHYESLSYLHTRFAGTPSSCGARLWVIMWCWPAHKADRLAFVALCSAAVNVRTGSRDAMWSWLTGTLHLISHFHSTHIDGLCCKQSTATCLTPLCFGQEVTAKCLY